MARKMLTGIDLTGQKATNVADGTNPNDAVNKGQLDSMAKGLVYKPSVKVATVGPITLSGTQAIDGVPVAAGDRVLVKDQADAKTNGIYVAAAGSWSRAADLDEGAEFTNGVAVLAQQGGGDRADRQWVVSTDGTVTIGTTAITWVQIGGGNTYAAGNGLALNNGTFSVVAKPGGGASVDGTGVSIDAGYSGLAKRFSTNVPAGSASVAISHNLGTSDVITQVRLLSTGEVVEPDITVTDTNTVTLGFAAAPSAGQYRVVVVA